VPGPVTSADLYLYDYKSASSTPDADADAFMRVELVGFDEGRLDFHTLGMSLHEESGTLFVANHRRESGAAVEVFHLDLASLASSFPTGGASAKVDGEKGDEQEERRTQSPPAPRATHVRTITHPLIHGPNSIAAVSSAEFFVTNDHYFLARDWPVLSLLETYLAPPFGTVVHVKLGHLQSSTSASKNNDDDDKQAVQAKVVARLPYANGIELLNATTLAVASTTNAAVYLYAIASSDGKPPSGAHPRLSYTGTKVSLPFLPDNLSTTTTITTITTTMTGADESRQQQHGREKKKLLLIAGHPHAPSTTRYAKTRHICNDPLELALANAEQAAFCADVGGRNRATSWVSLWDWQTAAASKNGKGKDEGEVRHLFSGPEYPSSATAARDGGRGVGIVAGLYARGILVWRE